MRGQRFARTRAVLQGGVIALLTAALVFALASRFFDSRERNLAGVSLSAGTNFLITSSVSSSDHSEVAANLEPGVTRYLWYTVHNKLVVPITVSSLSITDVAPPAGCPASNLDVSHTTFSGSLVVPGKTGANPGTNRVAVPIKLAADPSGGNACQNATFTFTFAGSATYTEVYATTTSVSSSANPSALNQAVTYTAAVTAKQGANQDPVPNSPSGKVTFKDGSTTICSNVPLVSASDTMASAQCTPAAYSSASTHSIKATFTNTDGNFSGSTSPVFSQVVTKDHTGTATELTSTPNPSPVGGSVTLTAQVRKLSGRGTPTGNVAFYLGTPAGTHTLLGNGTLRSSGRSTISTSSLPAGADSLYAVYAGDSNFAGSTAPAVTQYVIALPNGCAGPYTWISSSRNDRVVVGTRRNDFIYAVRGEHRVYGRDGDDCVQVGDEDNAVFGGDDDDVVLAGSGNNYLVPGSGDDRVTVGAGRNRIALGNDDNTVTITGGGSRNTITAGRGDNTIYLGSGRYNSFVGGRGNNVCHVPAPPSSWNGSAAAYYRDTIKNCRVVSP